MKAREVEYLAKKLKLKLYRTCVKENLNVNDVFAHLGFEFARNGGEANLGAGAITSIEDVATKPLAERSNNIGKSGAAGSAATDKAVPQGGSSEQQPFKLNTKPSVQRTGGKKHKFQNCSVL